MPESITAIHVKRFKKFEDNDLTASAHNVLVGANNSGKTSILHALRLFFFFASGEFSGAANHVEFHRRYVQLNEILPVSDSKELWFNCLKGNQKSGGVSIQIQFESQLTIEISFTHRFGQVHVDGSVTKNPNNLSGDQINDVIGHKVAFIPGLVGILPQEPYITPARRSAMSIETRYSEMYRSSLLHLNETDKRDIKKVNKVLSKHLNVEILDTSFNPDQDVFVDVKYSQHGVSFDLSNAGSGMLQVIQLLVYIYLYKPSLLLIDEPDAHLHPELQRELAGILKEVSDDLEAQLFIATHSPDVIDSFGSDEVYFVNASKKHLRPLKNESAYVENLLKDGIITNSGLSRIAVRPKCLVLEDENIKVLKKIDNVCGFGLLDAPGEHKSAKGVSKFPAVSEVYLTVQDVVGKKIELYFLQDSDGLPDRYLDYIRERYKKQGLEVRILNRHEIENYLLDAKIVKAALLYRGYQCSLAETRQFIKKAAEEIKHSVRRDIREKAKNVNRICRKSGKCSDKDVETDVDAWFDGLKLDEKTILKIFPGKELKTTLFRILQKETGIGVHDADLLGVLKRRQIDSELKTTLKAISDKRRN